MKTVNLFEAESFSNGRVSPEAIDNVARRWADHCRANGMTSQPEVEYFLSSQISGTNPDLPAYVKAVMNRLAANDDTRFGAVMEECNVGPAPRQMAAEADTTLVWC